MLLVLVLGAFFFDWRTALISFVAIPLSLLAAGLVLHLRNATLNVMVLAGLVIAIGVIVDDAIIDVENILRRLYQRRREGSDQSAASIILEASLEVRGAVFFATLIMPAGSVAGLLPARTVPALFPAAGRLLCAGGAGLPARRPDRHADVVH